MTDDELRSKNADLGSKINEVLRNHPELQGAAEEIALKQGLWVQVGTSFLERVQANLRERARAIIELRPDLERLFAGGLLNLSSALGPYDLLPVENDISPILAPVAHATNCFLERIE